MTASACPTISVVLPTKNRSATLPRAVDSVLGQGFRDIEVVVVDDGSTDDTAMLLERYRSDPRIRLVRHESTFGPGAARNTGIYAARADWIAFQDSDDVWHPDKLARQWHLAQARPELDFICCEARDMDAAGAEIRARKVNFTALRQDPARYLLTPLPFITPTWLVRKSALLRAGGFRTDLLSSEDWELCLRLSDFARFDGVERVLVDKFAEGPSVFRDLDRRHQGVTLTMRLHRHRWLRNGWHAQFSALELLFAMRMANNGRADYGLVWAARAWRDSPTNLRALRTMLLCAMGDRGYRLGVKALDTLSRQRAPSR
jgi:glycosyltransferase involved in cell wall biosynthesis